MTSHFETDDEEVAWIIDDIVRDRAEHGHDWGDVALLYRKHEIGDALEGAFLNAGIPCRLAQGRALSEDPVVGVRARGAARDLEPDATPSTATRSSRRCFLGRCSTRRARRRRRIGTTSGASSITWRRGCRAPTRTAVRFVARSPTGRISTR